MFSNLKFVELKKESFSCVFEKQQFTLRYKKVLTLVSFRTLSYQLQLRPQRFFPRYCTVPYEQPLSPYKVQCKHALSSYFQVCSRCSFLFYPRVVLIIYYFHILSLSLLFSIFLSFPIKKNPFTFIFERITNNSQLVVLFTPKCVYIFFRDERPTQMNSK